MLGTWFNCVVYILLYLCCMNSGMEITFGRCVAGLCVLHVFVDQLTETGGAGLKKTLF